MKKFYSPFLMFLMMNIFTFSQSWTQKSSIFNYGRYCAIGCSANGKGYAGMGQIADGTYLNDFWEYDPVTNQWTGKTGFPAGGRYGASAYSIKGKLYVCFGYDNDHNCRNDIWEYNPGDDTWVQKATFPGQARYGASGFVINDSVLFVGTGTYGNQFDYFYDFWMYNPVDDSWMQKSDFPGNNRQSATSFSINGMGYLGSGLSDAVTAAQDFWKYNPVFDTWSAVQDLPGEKAALVSFAIAEKGYVGSGAGSYPFFNTNDFFAYDPGTNTWTSITTPDDAIPRRYGIGYSIDNTGYFGTGYCDDGLLTDFWAFNEVISGIEKIGNTVACKMFPNPAADRIQLQLAEGFHPQHTNISIYDMKGQVLLQQTVLQDNSKIDIHELEKGFYIVKILVDNDILFDRFTKE